MLAGGPVSVTKPIVVCVGQPLKLGSASRISWSKGKDRGFSGGQSRTGTTDFFGWTREFSPTIVDWRINALKDEMPVRGSYSVEDVAVLNTRNNYTLTRTPIQKTTRALLCNSRNEPEYFGDDVDRNCLTLIRATKSLPKVGQGPNLRAAYKTPRPREKSPLDFANEDSPLRITEGDGMTEPRLQKEVAAMGPPVNKRRRKRDNAEAEANAPPKVLRKDHAPVCPEQSTRGGKSLASIGLEADSTFTSTAQETPVDVKDPKPLSYAKPHTSSRVPATEIPAGDVDTTEVPGLFSTESPESKRSMPVPSVEGSPRAIYQPGWGVTNDCRLYTPEACQDMVDHTVPPGFEQEVRLLKKARAQVARRNERIQVREEEIKRLGKEVESLKVVEMEVHGLRNQTKNLETLLEAEVDMKKATEAKNAELARELESLRAKFSDLELNNNQLSQQVSTLQAQLTGEERIKAAFEEFKKYEDDKVEKRCTEIDARLDALSIDFDEELHPHMLTRLAVMKYVESIKLRQVFANVVSAGIAKAIPEKMLHNRSVSFAPALPSSQYLYTRRSDGVPVSVPTIAPQGLAILLADAATQTDISKDEAFLRLLRSKSLPPPMASAFLFLLCGTWLIEKLAKPLTRLLTFFKYLIIFSSLATYAPSTWFATNLESTLTCTLHTPICAAIRRPAISASYSASLLEAVN
ncbi:hypothetical protein Tco_0092383 [Tanacetum coccineum]